MFREDLYAAESLDELARVLHTVADILDEILRSGRVDELMAASHFVRQHELIGEELHRRGF